MKINDIMQILQDDMKIAVVSTVDEDGQPHARHINMGGSN